MKPDVEIYDTTLRDGSQGEGINFSVHRGRQLDHGGRADGELHRRALLDPEPRHGRPRDQRERDRRLEPRLLGRMLYGTVDGTGTNSATQIETTATSEATTDHFVGRACFFTSGALQYQAARITAYRYTGGRGRFTVEAMTDTPAGSDGFIIV